MGDLERLLDSLSTEDRELCSLVTETLHADYLYRVEIPKHIFAKVAERIAGEIDYGNFKDSVHEGYSSPRDAAYMGCWAELKHGQEIQAKVKQHGLERRG